MNDVDSVDGQRFHALSTFLDIEVPIESVRALFKHVLQVSAYLSKRARLAKKN